MFTGLVQAVGEVRSLVGARLLLSVPPVPDWEPFQLGESICVNGTCLTLVSFEGCLAFDVSAETFARTCLGDLKPGSRVNLERSLRVGDRMGGHYVTGHIDTVGHVLSRNGESFTFRVPVQFASLLVDKGSAAIDGVSLTVIRPRGGRFMAALIPHTLEVTSLSSLEAKDKVNIEFDILAKYAQRMLTENA